MSVLVTLDNLVTKLDRYLIAKVKDLFARLRQGHYYTKLDLSQGVSTGAT